MNTMNFKSLKSWNVFVLNIMIHFYKSIISQILYRPVSMDPSKNAVKWWLEGLRLEFQSSECFEVHKPNDPNILFDCKKKKNNIQPCLC